MIYVRVEPHNHQYVVWAVNLHKHNATVRCMAYIRTAKPLMCGFIMIYIYIYIYIKVMLKYLCYCIKRFDRPHNFNCYAIINNVFVPKKIIITHKHKKIKLLKIH